MLEKLCQREDIWLILLSRGMVPRWLVPLYVSHSFLAIDEKELLMDREGQELYFELWDLKPLPETEEIVWQLAAGNPLALRMCAMELSNLKSKLSMKGQSHQARQESERECIKAARNLFFQYLETQEIEHWGQETQEFLMDLSVVDEFDIELAKEITGKTDVSQHILQIQELGDILYEENGVYRFRNPFRDVLFQRLRRVCSEKRINALYYNAGHYYEIRNNLPKALEIYDQSHDEESISRILIHNARKTPAGGYYFDLRKYYLSLSESIVKENPTLMSGLSMLNSLLMNADESERWYSLLEEYAKNHTGSDRREARNQLIYLDITLPHRGSQKLQDILKNVGTLIRDHKLILREVSVTANMPSQMNGGKDFSEWSKRETEFVESIGKLVSFALGGYAKAFLSLVLAESFFEKGKDNYEVITLAEKGRMQAESVGKFEQVFVALTIIAKLSLLNGKQEDAIDLFEGFEKTIEADAPMLLPNVRTQKCRFLLYKNRVREMNEWLADAPDENLEFRTLDRFHYLMKVRVYIHSGKYEQAVRLLHILEHYAVVMHRTYIQMEVKLLLGIALHRLNETSWKTYIQECITQAEEYHFVRLITQEGIAVLRLLKAEKFVWKDDNFKKQVFEECEKMAAFYPSYLKGKDESDVVLPVNALNVLRLQAEGYSNAEIAERLGITVSTVKYHSQETYKKLGVTSKTAAVNEARNRRIL